jgi:tRNA G46 methylase TrmB
MGVLSRLRSNTILNRIIRTCLSEYHRRSNKLMLKLESRWWTAGVTPCQFDEYEFKMDNACDDGIVNYFYYGQAYHEKADLALFGKLSKGASCIIDIGANTGLFSIIGSKANPSASIYSFEPYSTNAVRLKRNIDLNELENVRCTQKRWVKLLGQ